MARRSVDCTSFTHSNPIPCASRVGPLLVSSIIVGRDPGSDTLPDDPDAQIANVFHHIGEMLREGGADWRHVAKITFHVPDMSFRGRLNAPWVERFPDPASRPARFTNVAGGKAVQAEFMAWVED